MSWQTNHGSKYARPTYAPRLGSPRPHIYGDCAIYPSYAQCGPPRCVRARCVWLRSHRHVRKHPSHLCLARCGASSCACTRAYARMTGATLAAARSGSHSATASAAAAQRCERMHGKAAPAQRSAAQRTLLVGPVCLSVAGLESCNHDDLCAGGGPPCGAEGLRAGQAHILVSQPVWTTAPPHRRGCRCGHSVS